MLGMAPAVVAAAKWLPETEPTYAQIACTAPPTQTLEFTSSGRYEPGDIVCVTGTKWAGTYRMTNDRVFVQHGKHERIG